MMIMDKKNEEAQLRAAMAMSMCVDQNFDPDLEAALQFSLQNS